MTAVKNCLEFEFLTRDFNFRWIWMSLLQWWCAITKERSGGFPTWELWWDPPVALSGCKVVVSCSMV
jgi:hypothetical protein